MTRDSCQITADVKFLRKPLCQSVYHPLERVNSRSLHSIDWTMISEIKRVATFPYGELTLSGRETMTLNSASIHSRNRGINISLGKSNFPCLSIYRDCSQTLILVNRHLACQTHLNPQTLHTCYSLKPMQINRFWNLGENHREIF